MLFSSTAFIMWFFPATLLAVALARRLRHPYAPMVVLLLASVVFYMYWRPSDILIVLVSVVANFAIARSARLSQRTKLVACIALNVGYLGLLKILISGGVGLGVDDQALLFGALGLPLGISFITFQQIAFVVDQAKKRDEERNFLHYLFFVMFFPQLVSGPIVRHRQILPQVFRRPFNHFNAAYFSVGFAYFGIGMAKKILIADPLAQMNSLMFNNYQDLETIEAWLNMFAYSFRIYFDFSSYADMAVGLGYMLGIQLPRNFNSPYKATNIAQFWRIWHISLHNFFKRYVYEELLRVPALARRTALVIVIVMVLSAVWHGVGLGYLAWGLGHAALLLAYRFARKRLHLRARHDRGAVAGFLSAWLARGLLFLAVSVLWLPFATNDLGVVGSYLGIMLRPEGLLQFTNLPLASLTDLLIVALAALLVFCAPNSHQISLGFRRKGWPLLWAAFLIVSCLHPMWRQTASPVPFVYFQF